MHCNVVINIENFKNLKYHIFKKKHSAFPLFTVTVAMNIKKYLQKENQLKY